MTTRGRVGAWEIPRPKSDGLFASRCIDLFGHRDMTALQFAFGRGHSQIEAWLQNTRPVPVDVLIILELLEHSKKKHWPQRWKDCAR